MQHLITCPDPDCGAPAEVTDRFTLASTDGTVVHVKTICARRHWFTLPAERIRGQEQPLIQVAMATTVSA